MEYDFDEQNLRETAEVVLAINPYAARYTVEELVNEMKEEVYRILDEDLGYVSIRGYMLSAFNAEGGRIGIKGSISSYAVKEFLKHKGKK